jgi:DNA-binding NarL/FixJ family response regulator
MTDSDGHLVLVVGRSDLVRRGLSSIAERGGLRVVAECRTPEAGIDALAHTMVNVAVMDADASDASSPHVAALAARCPLLVLTPDGDIRAALTALQAGARGCVPRSSPADVLLAEIKVAAHGATVIASSTAQELLRTLADGTTADRAAARLHRKVHDRLTSREIEVLVLISKGWNNAHIGVVLFISPRTVKNHVASILEKLELENRIQAAVCAVQVGLADQNSDGGDPGYAGSPLGAHPVGDDQRASSTVAKTIIG